MAHEDTAKKNNAILMRIEASASSRRTEGKGEREVDVGEKQAVGATGVVPPRANVSLGKGEPTDNASRGSLSVMRQT